MTRRRAIALLLALLVGAAALAVAAAVVLVPRYARELAVWQLEAATGRRAALDALEISFRTGAFSARGLRLVDHDGGVLAELERLEGRFRPRRLLRGHLSFERLALVGPWVRLVRVGPGRFNISDLLERPAGRRLLDVTIERLTVAGGRAAVEDRLLTPVRTWRADAVRLDALDLTTRAPRGTAFGSATIAGALLTVRADGVQLAPLHLRAHVNLRDLDLRLPALYLPADTPLTLERGSIDAGISVSVDPREGARLDAEAVIERLGLRRRGQPDDAVTAPALRILVRDLHQRPGAVVLRYASLGGDLTVLDPTTSPPRPLTFSDVTVTASGLEQPMVGLARIAAHAIIPGGGEVDIGGTAGVTPRRADLRVRARAVELATLARYLPLPGRLTGLGTTDVRVVAEHARSLALAVTGDVRIDRLALADGTRTLAAATRVAATGLAYTWPARVDVGELTITQPALVVERDADGAIGLAALVRPPPADDASPPPTAAPDVTVARLRIDDGRVSVSDARSGGRVDVTRLLVGARNVGWPGRGVADVELSAAVAGGEVSARGAVDAARRRADLAVGARGADLAVLRPWLPLAARVDGTLDRAALRVTASHEDVLALAVAGDATIDGLALSDGGTTPVSVARLGVRGLDYTWPGTLRVTEVTLTRPAAAVERATDGVVNLAALLRPARPSPASAEADPVPRAAVDVAVARLQVDGGRASVTDAAAGATVQLAELSFTGEDLTWPLRGASRVQLAADVAGGRLGARGTVDGARRQGELVVTIRSADLAALQPWLPIVGRIRGAADADVTATIALDPFELAVSGRAGATDLAFLEGERPLLTVDRVDVAGLDLRWPASLAIDRLRVQRPWAQIDRTAQGELSLRALFRRRPDRPAPALQEPVAAGPVPGLEVTVRDALFDDGGVNIVDDAVEPAARFEVRGSRLELRDLTWPARGPTRVQLATPMPGGGTLRARGTLSIEPTRLQLDVELDQVALAPGRPYLPIDARLSGRVSGRARITGAFGDTIALLVEGQASVDRLALGDDERRLLRAEHAELSGLRYRYPASLRIRHVALRKPWALVERNADGTLEIAALLTRRRRPPPSASPVASPPASPAARIGVALDRVTLEDGFLRFVDRSTDPDFAEELSGVTLTAERVGTNPRRHGAVQLHGLLASGQPLSVRGEVGAVTGPPFLDLTVAVADYPVPRLNPYLDRISSHVARRGTLTAALRSRLDGDVLEATNQITLAGLDLEEGGRGDEDRRRVGLPLGLLVSLLKNRQGVIELNLPVRGQLSAPEFDYRDAMWTALRNLAIKVVSLPFSWVGQMLYTEDARIDSVQLYPIPFQTARAAPTGPGGEMLGRLATFLRDTPAIRLRLRPVTTVADVTALRREALDARLSAPGADAAARRQAALALYAELFPRREPPATDAALLEELTRETRTPPGALRTLASERAKTVRDTLVRAGVAAERLEPVESRAAVESQGEGRVEFEILR